MEDTLDDFAHQRRIDFEIRAFVGPYDQYYLDRWHQAKAGKFLMFNWAAFIFGMGWFLYRKMYLESILFLVIIIIESELTSYFFGHSQWLELSLQAIYALCAGFLGNYFYVNSIRIKIERMKKYSFSDPDLTNNLKRIGGVSWLAAVFGLILLFTILMLIDQYGPRLY